MGRHPRHHVSGRSGEACGRGRHRRSEKYLAEVLEDTRHGCLKPRYDGGLADVAALAPARHDLLPARYAFGAHSDHPRLSLELQFLQRDNVQRAQYRQRPIADVVREFQAIREKRVWWWTTISSARARKHIARAKDLFRALAAANVRKNGCASATINFADDEELLALAAKPGAAVFHRL